MQIEWEVIDQGVVYEYVEHRTLMFGFPYLHRDGESQPSYSRSPAFASPHLIRSYSHFNGNCLETPEYFGLHIL